MHPRTSLTLYHRFTYCKHIKTDYVCKRHASTTSNNQIDLRTLFNEFGKRNNFQIKDWYELSVENLDTRAKEIVNNRFQGSMFKLVSTIFPEIEWHAWKFKHQKVPSGFWSDVSNQRKYFDQLGQEIGIEKLDDWYHKLNSYLLRSHDGGTILTMHNGSAIKALQAAYPEHRWLPWKFRFAPKFWKSIENQRKYFEWLGKELGVEKMDDWYKVLNQKVIEDNDASTLLKLYNFSPSKALMACYPEYDWKPWKFQMTVQGYWDSTEHVSKFLSELAEKFSIQTLDDWYRVDRVQLLQHGAARLLAKHGGLYSILKKQYPQHPWDPKRFQRGRKGQRWLLVTIKSMFPGEGNASSLFFFSLLAEIIEDYIHPKAVSPTTKRPLQLDVFIPSRSLAFEYQGQQHFQDIGIFQPQKVYERRDSEKRHVCATNNIKLVEVPYWWNRSQEALKEMIEPRHSADALAS